MGAESDAKRLRIELEQLGGSTGRRYSAPIKARIARAAAQLRAEGFTWGKVRALIGIPYQTIQRFVGEQAAELSASVTPSFVPVHVTTDPAAAAIVLITNDGHRVEGVSVDTVIAIVRGLR